MSDPVDIMVRAITPISKFQGQGSWIVCTTADTDINERLQRASDEEATATATRLAKAVVYALDQAGYQICRKTTSKFNRAGLVLSAVLDWMPDDYDPWKRHSVVSELSGKGSEKEISNALAYLVRKGEIRRLSYGRYARNVR